MERISCSLFSGGDSTGEGFDGLPARSSSAPPDRPGAMAANDAVGNTAFLNGAASWNVAYSQTSQWVESHVPCGSVTSSPAAEFMSLYPSFTSQSGHNLDLWGSQSRSLQASGNGSRMHFTPGPRTSLGRNLSSSLGLAFDSRSNNPGFSEVIPQCPFPACSLPTSDGRIEPASAAEAMCFDEGHTSGQVYHSEHCDRHSVMRHGGHDVRQQALTSRVEVLDLSSPRLMASLSMHHGPSSTDDASNRPRTDQEWLHSASFGQFGLNNLLRIPYLDEALRNGPAGSLETAYENGQERNPMWGLGESRANISLEYDYRTLYGLGQNGHETSTTTGGTNSLASCRSLPELTWSSNDPWLSRPGSEWTKDEHDDGLQGKREGSKVSEAADRNRNHPTSISSRADATTSINTDPEEAAMRSSRPVPGSEAKGEKMGGNRLEEGSIGSKSRTWYRAPNGQFASASQALSFQFTGEGEGNGQGGPRLGEGIRRIRRRRKSEEVERKYRCDFDGCDKAYGTLNHLNTHRATNEHGPRLNAVGYRKAHAEWLARQAAGQNH